MWGYGSARLALRALTTRRLDRRDAALEELDAEPSSSRWAALRQRYDLGEELGSGGGGRVFSGRCKARGLPVAIKAVKAHLAAELPREAQLLGEARHRAVLRVHECLPEDGFLVTERLDGGELFDRLARRELVGDARAQRNVLGDVFDAVAFLHDAGIAHLDLKPENIVLEDDEEWNVRLVDFGSARRVDGRDGRDGAVGIHDSPRTAAYAPPELLRRERGVDPKKVDAWAAGVVAYFVFTGRHPFDGGGPATTDRDVERAVLAGAEAAGRFEGADWARVPAAMRGAVARCLSPDPPRADARELADAEWIKTPAPQHRLVLDRGEAARWVLDGGERAP
ncbi:serine/threonine kinase [Aureococcus anophagefferens]|nr:serine/threonine kinase [Aureococcus anophagefferens]